MGIPRTIHRLWLGEDEPEWQEPFLQTWVDHHPEEDGWEVWQWDAESLAEEQPFDNQAVIDAAHVICPDHANQLISDVVRYELLKRHGGVWVDADFECLKSLEPLLGGKSWVAWEQHPVWVNNAIVAFEKGHKMLVDVIEGLQANVEANMGSKPNVMTGPWYVTRVWHRHKYFVDALPEWLFYPFGWDEVDMYSPYDDYDVEAEWPDAYAIHWWHNKRREKGIA